LKRFNNLYPCRLATYAPFEPEIDLVKMMPSEAEDTEHIDADRGAWTSHPVQGSPVRLSM
jgi:hypothetical protein